MITDKAIEIKSGVYMFLMTGDLFVIEAFPLSYKIHFSESIKDMVVGNERMILYYSEWLGEL